jgi:flagellar hook-associated protein 1 FlgK
MSLSAAFQIGRSALTASQLGIQVAGNNLANAATPGYSRQLGILEPSRGDNSTFGQSVGHGVQVRAVRRQIDEALQQRLWAGSADQALSQQQASILSQVESSLGELGDNDLSSQLSAFWRSWSERGNNTRSNAVVVQQGQAIADFMHRLHADLTGQRKQLDDQLAGSVDRANQLLTTIAGLNGQISQAEVGGGQANPLRDQRDSAITELSSLMDVSVVDRGQQGVDVLVGSTPVVLGARSRGLDVTRVSENGQTSTWVSVHDNAERLGVTSGAIAGLLGGREGAINDTIKTLDTIAAQLAFQVNRLHSTGANAERLTSTTGSLSIIPADRARAINDPTSQTFGKLPYQTVNGGFVIHVRQTATGAEQTIRINVDLDGITAAGVSGTADDTTPEQLRASLDGIAGIAASFDSNGKLRIDADSGYDFAFSDDTSGALAVLGVNSYFTGTDATNLAVRTDLTTNPERLAAGRIVNGTFVDNGTAVAIAGLQESSVTGLGNRSISSYWRDAAQGVGAASASAMSRADAASVVRESLESQRAAVSGVNVDEESINLLAFQRQYQGAAKLISVADELTQTLINLI